MISPRRKRKVVVPLMIDNSLSDVIVVLYDGTTASICVPENKVYMLPNSYEGDDGNQIELSYLSTSNDVYLDLQGNDCEISKRSSRFVFVMKDNDIGMKRIKLTAVVYLAANQQVLATEEFYLYYERKAMPDHILTSVVCSFSNYYKDRYCLYPGSVPLSIDVYSNGNHTIYYNIDKRTQVLTYPFVEVSSFVSNPYTYGNYGNCFTWDKKGFSVFNKEYYRNAVKITVKAKTNPSTSIKRLQSKSLSEFLSAFSDLSLVILSANSEDRNTILQILDSCSNKTMLPTIRNAAKSVLNMVSNHGSLLEWNSTVNKVKREAIKVEEQPENIPEEEEKLYTVNGNGDGEEEEMHSKRVIQVSEKLKREVQNRVANMVENEVTEQTDTSTPKKPKDLSTQDAKEKEEDYRSVNYKAYLEIMNKMSMDEIFEMICNRRMTNKYVEPLNTTNTLTRKVC